MSLRYRQLQLNGGQRHDRDAQVSRYGLLDGAAAAQLHTHVHVQVARLKESLGIDAGARAGLAQ